MKPLINNLYLVVVAGIIGGNMFLPRGQSHNAEPARRKGGFHELETEKSAAYAKASAPVCIGDMIHQKHQLTKE